VIARAVMVLGTSSHAGLRKTPPSQFSLASVLLLTCTMSMAQAKPQRIVSTSPSITETLFALGIGDRVVGVSQFYNYPPEVQKLPKVGSYISPDAEAIARLAPDLVVLEQNSSALAERLDLPWIIRQRTPRE
jgi:ABC-type hemin transport system substrate-binding protein